jgi:hypothetical protein
MNAHFATIVKGIDGAARARSWTGSPGATGTARNQQSPAFDAGGNHRSHDLPRDRTSSPRETSDPGWVDEQVAPGELLQCSSDGGTTMGSTPTLKKGLNDRQLRMIAIGGVIGAGLFA